jgi:hypothetical protein
MPECFVCRKVKNVGGILQMIFFGEKKLWAFAQKSH